MDQIPCAKHLAIRSNSHDKEKGSKARTPTLSTSSGTGTQPSFSIYYFFPFLSFLSLEPVPLFLLSIKGRECNLDRKKPPWQQEEAAITDPSQPSIPAREPKESESEHRLKRSFFFLVGSYSVASE